MAREKIGSPGEIQARVEGLLRGMFADGARRVIDYSMLLIELELQGVGRDEKRAIATSAIAGMKAGQLDGIFGFTAFAIKRSTVKGFDGSQQEVFYREGMSREAVEERYEEERAHYDQIVEDRREFSSEAAQQNLTGKKKKKGPQQLVFEEEPQEDVAAEPFREKKSKRKQPGGATNGDVRVAEDVQPAAAIEVLVVTHEEEIVPQVVVTTEEPLVEAASVVAEEVAPPARIEPANPGVGETQEPTIAEPPVATTIFEPSPPLISENATSPDVAPLFPGGRRPPPTASWTSGPPPSTLDEMAGGALGEMLRTLAREELEAAIESARAATAEVQVPAEEQEEVTIVDERAPVEAATGEELEVSPEQVRTKVFLTVLGKQRGDDNEKVLQRRINFLVGNLENRQQEHGIPPSVRREILTDPTEAIQDKSRVLVPADIQHILQEGITREALQSLFPLLRQKIIHKADLLEEELVEVAKEINGFASLQLDAPEEGVFVAIPAMRVATLALVHNLIANSKDDRVAVDYHIGNHSDFYDLPSHPYYILDVWHNRLYGVQLIASKNILQNDERPLAKRFVEMVSHPDRKNIFKELAKNKEVVFNDSIITLDDIDSLLAPIMLPDEVLLRAIFQDILGAAYTRPHISVGEDREAAFIALRLVTNQFGVEEIYNLLSGHEADPAARKLAVGQLQERIARTESMLSTLRKSDRIYGQTRTALSKTKAELAGLQRQNKVLERIAGEVEQRIPGSFPSINDYKGGAKSFGYQRALGRYERYRERNTSLVPPNPVDYTEGGDSSGYRDDVALYQSLRTISPGITRDGIVATAAQIGNEESILQESIY